MKRSLDQGSSMCDLSTKRKRQCSHGHNYGNLSVDGHATVQLGDIVGNIYIYVDSKHNANRTVSESQLLDSVSALVKETCRAATSGEDETSGLLSGLPMARY